MRGLTVPEALLEARAISVEFAHRGGRGTGSLRAVDGVSVSVAPGERLGIVGESGSGKSTLCKALAGIQPLASGEIRFRGAPLPFGRSPVLRRAIQIVFQDPYTSLNPKLSIQSVLREALAAGPASPKAPDDAVTDLLRSVGLSPAVARARPSKLSGGQRQRAAIARALAVQPAVVLADEVTSALDVSVQAVIVNLLERLATEHKLTLIFVTHNLQVVRALCSRICVMHAGRIVETATTDQIFGAPAHPYTQALLAATPRLRPGARNSRSAATEGPREAVTEGCAYRSRCSARRAKCAVEVPELAPLGPVGAVHDVACHVAADGRTTAEPAPAVKEEL